MPELRKSLIRRLLRSPEAYLAAYFACIGFLLADTFRAPEDQFTGRLYVKAVELYQEYGDLLLQGRIHCRYIPSCSQYSIEAVENHGVRRGLVLSYHRIKSCKHGVTMGTHDPPPPPE